MTVVEDSSGNPVGGALLSIDLRLDSALDASFSGTTANNGAITFQRKKAPSGTYTIDASTITVDDCNVTLVDAGFTI